MYLTYISPQKIFYGKWVGSGYDGDLLEGFVVFATDKDIAVSELNKIITDHPDGVRIIGYDFN